MAYPIPAGPITVEQQVKRSRFLCTVEHCPTRELAEAFIRRIGSQHQDASHNCWAMIAGPPDDPSGYAMSDDGEPRGCAGKPMFTVLHHSGIGEIAVVVSRWFGGIKLGTGGMARAYSSTVKQALTALPLREKIFLSSLTLTLPYDLHQAVQHLLNIHDGSVTNQKYGELVTLEIALPKEKEMDFLRDIAEQGQGRIVQSDR